MKNIYNKILERFLIYYFLVGQMFHDRDQITSMCKRENIPIVYLVVV